MFVTIFCSGGENYGQQCCYSNTQAGNLVKEPSGGGSADSYSPSTNYNLVKGPSGGGSADSYSPSTNYNLVKGPSGGGSADSYSPSTNYNQHLIRDLVPYILCCKVDPALPSCKDYYEARPSGSEMGYELPVPG